MDLLLLFSQTFLLNIQFKKKKISLAFHLPSTPTLHFPLLPCPDLSSLPTPRPRFLYPSETALVSRLVRAYVRVCVPDCVSLKKKKTKNMINNSSLLHQSDVSNILITVCTNTWNTVHYIDNTYCIQTSVLKTGDFCLRAIKHLPLIVGIGSVCFTLFTAILLKSLISCIIEQPVYMSQSGCDGSVCVCVCESVDGWTGFHLTDVMASWNQSSGTLFHAEVTSSLLVMEDTRQMIVLWDRHRRCLEKLSLHVYFPIFKSMSSNLRAGDSVCSVCVCVCVC